MAPSRMHSLSPWPPPMGMNLCMFSGPLPLTRELVLVGGGHAHALVLKRWGMNPVPGARLTVINPGATAPYTGMLPGFVAGHYGRDDLEIDLVRLARFAGARLILGYADGIDTDAKRIHIADRGAIAYDIASIDVGIHSDMPSLPGFDAHGVPAKPLHRFADAWATCRAGTGPLKIAVIGGGVGGVELAMAMTHAVRTDGRAVETVVIEADEALPGLGDGARMTLTDRMAEMQITILEGVRVSKVQSDGVTLSDGRQIEAGFTVGAAGARPWPWLAELGLTHKDGFLTVDETLRTSDPNIYAAGDCAHLSHAPRPKAGVYAVRAAPVLTHNLRADLTGGSRKAFHPQADFLKLISLGEKSALGEKWGRTFKGPWVWRWKDHIDRTFMNNLADLDPMARPAAPRGAALGVTEALGDKPSCGGCGSKVGPEALESALAARTGATREDVQTLPGDDAALIRLGDSTQVLSTDHLRAFTEDPYLMARIAAVHALGDVWAMGATPQAALATVILPPLSDALQRSWLVEIMAGADEVFGACGATVAGGHTSTGTELTIGFAVTGLLPEAPVTRAGARPGDVLLLTRPLGAGTIMAADMALAAPGPAVATALATMATPQIEAAGLLRDAHAMTDVTGFGLAGHLLGICRTSSVAATIALDHVPLYDGALSLAKAGIRSTLYPANEAAASLSMTLPDDPRVPLLFDPQTAGGLLAALPRAQAEEIRDVLRAQGVDAAVIGEITEGAPHVTVTSAP